MQKQRRQLLYDNGKACFSSLFFLTKQWSLRFVGEVFRRSAAESSRCVLHSTLHLHALLFKLFDGAAYLGVRVASASGGRVLSRGCAPVCQSHR